MSEALEVTDGVEGTAYAVDVTCIVSGLVTAIALSSANSKKLFKVDIIMIIY